MYDYELVCLPRACTPDDGGYPPEFEHASVIAWSSVNNDDLTKIQEVTRNDVAFSQQLELAS